MASGGRGYNSRRATLAAISRAAWIKPIRPARATLFAIDYTARSTFGDATARWKINDRVAIGGELRWFDTHGSVGWTRDDDRAFLELRLSRDYSVRSLIVTSNT